VEVRDVLASDAPDADVLAYARATARVLVTHDRGLTRHARLWTGLCASEIAVIEKIDGTAVPAATVRTKAGRSRQVPAIDQEPVIDEN
jgi:hypothetical protein